MFYEIYFLKHYYLFLKKNNLSLMSQNRHPSTTDTHRHAVTEMNKDMAIGEIADLPKKQLRRIVQTNLY